jgi:hypothetical protein
MPLSTAFDPFFSKHCVCFEFVVLVKELPFAGYSVVKESVVVREADLQAGPQSRGGEYRARTGDLLVANQALSQLS